MAEVTKLGLKHCGSGKWRHRQSWLLQRWWRLETNDRETA